MSLPPPPQPPFPNPISIDDELFKKQCPSVVLEWVSGSKNVTTIPREKYGPSDAPHAFSIGNGGAGYTGMVRALAEGWLKTQSEPQQIWWVTNHSRYTQAALLGNIVQVALTYEPFYEDASIKEGWAKRASFVAWDHFIVVGPKSNPAGVQLNSTAADALKTIAAAAEKGGIAFHSRGDGSATFEKETLLFKQAGVYAPGASWFETKECTPYDALKGASAAGAYMISDRSTYLTAVRDGVVPQLCAYCEGGELLLNPMSAMVRIDVDQYTPKAAQFAKWLGEKEAQEIVESYGKSWAASLALYTRGGDATKEFAEDQRLAGKA